MLSPYPSRFLGNSFPFFMAQAAFITVEDAVVALGTRVGVNETRWMRTLGYAWTFAWLVYSTPFLNDWHLRAGMGRHRVFGFEIVGPGVEWVGALLGVDVLEWVRESCAV